MQTDKTYRKSTSIVHDTIADLKRRKQMMLGSVQSEVFRINDKKSTSFGQISNGRNITDISKEKSTSVVLHIDESFFKSPQQQHKLHNFLDQYFSHQSFLPIKQLQLFSSLSSNQTQKQSCQVDFREETQTKIIKMNLKFCIHSKNHSSKNHNTTLNFYIVLSHLVPYDKKIHYKHLIDWNQEPKVCIVQDSTNSAYQIYLGLLTSFCANMSLFQDIKSQYFQNKMIPSIFVVNKLQDLLQQKVFEKLNGQQNFNRLCELQYSLFKAETQLKVQEEKEKIRSRLMVVYFEKKFKKSVTQLIKFMGFYKRKQKNLNLKYFNLWSLVTCESVLMKIDRQIIDQKYCQQRYEKQLKTKTFTNWKIYHLKKKDQKY